MEDTSSSVADSDSAVQLPATAGNADDMATDAKPAEPSEAAAAVEAGDQPDNNKAKKASRKRKKHTYNTIRQTMEFYFSDANLSKDRFLMRLVEADPEVPLATFLTFNKIKALASTAEEIEKALSTSELLRLSDDRTKVARLADLATLRTRCPDECTVYVEALPPTATHDWVRRVFEPYGRVAYVSLPKYRGATQRIKEFAFVEFEQRSAVLRTMQAFGELGGVLNAAADPERLVSVLAYLREQAEEKSEAAKDGRGDKVDGRPGKEKVASSKQSAKKTRKRSNDAEEPNVKKTRRDDGDDAEQVTMPAAAMEVGDADQPTAASNRREADANASIDDGSVATATIGDENDDQTARAQSAAADDGGDGDKVGRKKATAKPTQSHSAAHASGKPANDAAVRCADASVRALRVTTKLEWKRLRNKYLNQQREKVKELKKKWWLKKQAAAAKEAEATEPMDDAAPAAEAAEPTAIDPPTTEQQSGKINFYGGNRKELLRQKSADESAPLFAKRSGSANTAGADIQMTIKEPVAAVAKPPLFAYEPGIIVRVHFAQPCVDVKDFKAEMRQHAFVRYVDVREGDLSAHVRLDAPASAADLSARAAPLRCEVLAGDAEATYWQKIDADRQQKLGKELKVKPRRGREKVRKVVAKAAAAAAAAAAEMRVSHMRFED